MESVRAWSLMALGDDRQYAGNSGYSDIPERLYRYDSHVANHKNVKAGDLVVLRSRTQVLGLARIQSIREKPGKKTMLRCPECRITGIKERQRKHPRYRCNQGHEFERPLAEEINVTLYEAHYQDEYIATPNAVTLSMLKDAALRRSDQLSIEEINASALETGFLTAYPGSREMFANFYQSEDLRADPAVLPSAEPSDEVTEAFVGSLADTRSNELKAIKQRRGQARFRDALIKRYGGKCVVTGCGAMDVLEAAHIWPYRDVGDNHPSNGLLLRADIHTLFDLNMIAIEPIRLRVHLAPALAHVGDYRLLQGTTLNIIDSNRPAADPLAHRWRVFGTKWGFQQAE